MLMRLANGDGVLGTRAPASGTNAELRALLHELNNQLAVISGYTELAALHHGTDLALAARLRPILAGTEMAAETVRRLQQLAHREL